MGRKGTGREGWGERGKRGKRVERGRVGPIPAADMHVAYKENTWQ